MKPTAKNRSIPASKGSPNTKNTATKLLATHAQLYDKLQVGLLEISYRNTRPFAEAIADIRSHRNK